jgi:hypothetical protein
MRPPLMPEEILRRVINRSRLNSWSVALFAGVCTIGSVVFGDPIGALVGLLVTVGGAMEVRGYRRLKRNDAGGVRWLVLSQLLVLVVICAYAISCLLRYNDQMVRESVLPRLMRLFDHVFPGIPPDELGLMRDEILRQARRFVHVLYGGVVAVTLIYQGGLACYYQRCKHAVEMALGSGRSSGQTG